MRFFLMKLLAFFACPSIPVRKGDSNYYDCENESITLAEVDEDDCGFMRHVVKVHGFKEASSYGYDILTVLHEVGHAKTLDFCESDELPTRALCASYSVEEARDSIAIQDLYFNLESEWEATEWAINFIKSHPFLCKAFSVLLR